MLLSRPALACSAALLVSAAAVTPAAAATCVSSNPYDWFNAAAWSCGYVPGISDDAILSNIGVLVFQNNLNVAVRSFDFRTIGFYLTNSNLRSDRLQTNYVENDLVLGRNSSFTFGELSKLVSRTGTGSVVLDDSSGFARLEGLYDLRIPLYGSGEIGAASSYFLNNNALINANVAGRALTFRGPAYDTEYHLNNAGTLLASNGGRIEFTRGGGIFNPGVMIADGQGSLITFSGGDLANLKGSGSSPGNDVLSGGTYIARNGGRINFGDFGGRFAELRDGAMVELDGSASRMFYHGADISRSMLLGVGADSRLSIKNGHQFFSSGLTNAGTVSVSAATLVNDGLFTNNGQLVLAGSGVVDTGDFSNVRSTAPFGSDPVVDFQGGTFIVRGSLTNSGVIAGTALVDAGDMNNTGLISARNGTLKLAFNTMAGSGTLRSEAGATLLVSASGGQARTGRLDLQGSLAIDPFANIIVETDYTNSRFGSGNSFDGRAGTAGGGILALSAIQTVSATSLANGILDLGAMRATAQSPAQFTVGNSGTSTTLRGAVKVGSGPLQVDTQDFTLAANGGSKTFNLSRAGELGPGSFQQKLYVVNNFDNVDDTEITAVGDVYAYASAEYDTRISLGAIRVGDTIVRDLAVTNTGPNTGGYTDDLGVTFFPRSSQGVHVSAASDLLIHAGQSAAAELSFNAFETGRAAGLLQVQSTSSPLAGTGLDSKIVSTDTIGFTGQVYQAAKASLVPTSVDLLVRGGQGTAGGIVSLRNVATGANGYVEMLRTTVASEGVELSGPATRDVGAGGAETFAFTFGDTTSGIHTGTLTFDNISKAYAGTGLADLTLGQQQAKLTATVTEIAGASLGATGDGILAGGGGVFDLDLGRLASGGSASAGLLLSNAIADTAWAERLHAAFTFEGGNGFSFSSNALDLTGGASGVAGTLGFNAAGLRAGRYTATLLIDPSSHFDGLEAFVLDRIRLNISALVGVAAVPEPTTWTQMIAGFAVLGAAARRRRRPVVSA